MISHCHCQHCHRHIEYDSAYIGHEITCPSCRHKTRFGISAPAIDLRAGFAQSLRNLTLKKGYCLMLDIVGSTKLKEECRERQWITRMARTFEVIWARTEVRLRAPNQSKVVGDMLMLWFSDDGGTLNPITLMVNLIDRIQEERLGQLPLKIAFTRCNRVGEISFGNTPDIYGREIDLTARLLALSAPREIIFNEPFYGVLKKEVSKPNQEMPTWFDQIQGPWDFTIKGFKRPVRTRKYRVPPKGD